VSNYVLHDFAKADHDWLEPLLGTIAENAPSLADGATDKFQSRVAHAVQADSASAADEKPASGAKLPASAEKGGKPADGSLAERLRRWFGS
jgi:peptidyl-tRNA hydrolase, PTH1 family